MSSDSKNTKSGMGFLPTLALIFITLKLCGVLGWSWLWVLSPLVAIAAFYMLGLVLVWVILS